MLAGQFGPPKQALAGHNFCLARRAISGPRVAIWEALPYDLSEIESDASVSRLHPKMSARNPELKQKTKQIHKILNTVFKKLLST